MADCTVTDRRCTCGRAGVACDHGRGGGRAQPSALLCRPLQRYWNVNVMQITAAGDGKRGRGEGVRRVNKLQKLFTCGREGGGVAVPSPFPALMSIAAL